MSGASLPSNSTPCCISMPRDSRRRRYLPALAVAGGFTFEDQIFKGLALGAPFVKLVGMARSPIAAAMVGKTIGRAIDDGQIPVYIEAVRKLHRRNIRNRELPAPGTGQRGIREAPLRRARLYTYYERLAQGLRQLMAGSRKFTTEYISRDDIAALTREAAEISGIRYVMEVDKEEVEAILANRTLVAAS